MAFGLTYRALSLWITSLAFLLLQTRAQSVDVSINAFKNLPAKLYFFDDTTVRVPSCGFMLPCSILDACGVVG